MRHPILAAGGAMLSLVVVLSNMGIAEARTRQHVAEAEGDHPLTITRHRHHGYPGIYRSGNHIVAIGGFSANGYGPGNPGSLVNRQAALNAQVRYETSGIYGYGADGLGGVGLVDPEDGYNNPSYGGAFNQYVGYNGVPTNLAFGPDFAFRRYADRAGEDDADVSWPSPQELGYQPVPGNSFPDDE